MRRGIVIASALIIVLSLVGTVAIFWDWSGSQHAALPNDAAGTGGSEGAGSRLPAEAADDPVAWSSGGISLAYPAELCRVEVLQDDGSGFRLNIVSLDGAALPRLDLQRLTAAEGLETPTETEFLQFAQAVLERYFSGGLASDAFTSGSVSLADGRWTVPITIHAPDGQTMAARVALLGSGQTRYLVVSLAAEGATYAADWDAMFDSVQAA